MYMTAYYSCLKYLRGDNSTWRHYSRDFLSATPAFLVQHIQGEIIQLINTVSWGVGDVGMCTSKMQIEGKIDLKLLSEL